MAEQTSRGVSPSAARCCAWAAMVCQRAAVETLVPPNFRTTNRVVMVRSSSPAGGAEYHRPAAGYNNCMVPLTVIAGFLGVGKTTAIRHLAGQRPPAERWVVLVNEFGEVGIDGALLSDTGDLEVRELAGGCLCCAGDAPFQVTLARALETLSPDRVLLEPTGLAEAGRIVDVLRRPPFSAQIALRATITLIDPRHVRDPRYTARGDWQSQVEAADVLVANRCDLADEGELRDFLRFAAELYPPRLRILTTTEDSWTPRCWTSTPSTAPRPRRRRARTPTTTTACTPHRSRTRPAGCRRRRCGG